MWKNIRASVEVFFGQVEYVVGEGHRIRFWHGPWSEPIPLKDLYPGLFACSVSKEAWIFELGLALYTTFALGLATIVCFLLFQVIRFPPRKRAISNSGFYIYCDPAQSALVKASTRG